MVRIRKHASSILSDQPATATARATQAKCELNLSPWDLIPFNPRFEFDYQLKIEDEFMCNSAGKELVFAPQRSLASFRKEEANEGVRKHRYKEEEDEDKDMRSLLKKKAKKKIGVRKRKDENYVRCVKTDGKTWQCKKEAQQGETLCEHHLVQLQSYQHKYYHSTKKAKPPKKARAGTAATTVVANKKRNKGRVESKPADFYYYSGFGPSWGKRRRGDDANKEQLQVVDDGIDHEAKASSSSLYSDQQEATSSPVHVSHDNQDTAGVFYEYEDEDDDDEEDGEDGKKRIRKPIKARSLKSLF